VANVEKGGPADKAGLESGDVVLAIDGRPIVASGDLPAFVGMAVPGQKVELKVWRQGAARTLNAQLADAKTTAVASSEARPGAATGRLGLALRPLAPQEKREAGVAGGLLIEGVSGAAERAGVEAGDVLLAIDGKPVVSVEQVRAAVASSGSAALLVQRGDQQIYVPVRIG
jgi:serine protease Do